MIHIGATSIEYEAVGYTADQLSAHGIACFNLGRESMREEAAKKIEPLAGFNGAMKIRSIEL